MKSSQELRSNPPGSPKTTLPWKLPVFLVLALGLFVALRFLRIQEWLKPVLDWMGRLGAWGPVLFIAIYILATVLCVPGSVLTLGAGAIFGLAMGSACVSAGATAGATAAFLLGRYVARTAIARKLEANEKLAAIDSAVAREGWKIVFLTRLSPVFPFTLLNYAFSLTRVSLGQYVLASWIGMMPGTVTYVYLGSLARVGSTPRPVATGEWTLYGSGLVATIAVTIFVTRLARGALTRKLNG